MGIILLYTPHNSLTLKWTIGLSAIIGGVLILLGFLTQIICILTFLGGITAALSSLLTTTIIVPPRFPILLTYTVVLALAIALLGPGAFSLDARLFGRREIIIPQNPRDPKS